MDVWYTMKGRKVWRGRLPLHEPDAGALRLGREVGGEVEVEGVEGAEVGVGDREGGCILLVKGLLFGHDCRSVLHLLILRDRVGPCLSLDNLSFSDSYYPIEGFAQFTHFGVGDKRI